MGNTDSWNSEEGRKLSARLQGNYLGLSALSPEEERIFRKEISKHIIGKRVVPNAVKIDDKEEGSSSNKYAHSTFYGLSDCSDLEAGLPETAERWINKAPISKYFDEHYARGTRKRRKN